MEDGYLLLRLERGAGPYESTFDQSKSVPPNNEPVQQTTKRRIQILTRSNSFSIFRLVTLIAENPATATVPIRLVLSAHTQNPLPKLTTTQISPNAPASMYDNLSMWERKPESEEVLISGG